jgi:hypothetical protein
MRLLDDLGWTRDDPADTFAITMANAELADVLRLIASRAADRVASVLHESAAEIEEGRHALNTCGEILEALTATEAAEAVLGRDRTPEA